MQTSQTLINSIWPSATHTPKCQIDIQGQQEMNEEHGNNENE